MSHLAMFPPLLAAQGESPLMSFLPIILMFVVLYLVVLRPMSKQEKARRTRVQALQRGDEVVIGGGILGRVTNADDPKLAVVEIADRVRIKVLKKDIIDTREAALEAAPSYDKDKDKKDAKSESDDKKKTQEDEARKGA